VTPDSLRATIVEGESLVVDGRPACMPMDVYAPAKRQRPSLRNDLRARTEEVMNRPIEPQLREGFYKEVAAVLGAARARAYRATNFAMVEAYWEIGRLIVVEEQRGESRAEYAGFLLPRLAARLTREYGRGYTETNLKYFRLFYLAFPARSAEEIRHTLCDELTWSHYRTLTRVSNTEARAWYLREAADQGWAVPYVLEFLGLGEKSELRETMLERAIIGRLQEFMLELGKGFAFVGRQYRISTETKHFFVDLVFYNFILKCFVLVDLKTAELTHQDIGQMDMYVRIFEDTVRGEDDNPTIGLILCAEKDRSLVKYSVLNESRQLFASKYRPYLPSEEDLQAELDRERVLSAPSENHDEARAIVRS
jgi:predicted nuclease of restriction endonuclease-like (RecB) superfamily